MLQHGVELEEPGQCHFGPFETFSGISEQQDPIGIPNISFLRICNHGNANFELNHMFFFILKNVVEYHRCESTNDTRIEQHNLNGILNIFIIFTSQLVESNCFLSSLAKIEISKE